MLSDRLKELEEKDLTVVYTGDARVMVSLGMTRQFDDVWLKPNVGLEVTVPDLGVDFRNTTTEHTDGYIDDLSEYLELKLLQLLVRLCELNGVSLDD
jgi:hypothetical protein